MSLGQSDKPLTRLAREILAEAEALDDYYATSGGAYPSLEEENDMNLNLRGAPESAIAARRALINNCSHITELLTDPVDAILSIGPPDIYVLSALFTLCEFEVPQTVPLDGAISYSDLSEKVKLNEIVLTRCLRLVILKYFFVEPERGFVAHSARSRVLATSEGIRACIYLRKAMLIPASFKAPDLISKHPDASEPPETAAELALGEPFFDHLGRNPDLEAKFGLFMQEVSSGKNSGADSGDVIAQAYPLGDYSEKTIVDVGGGIGHISIAFAKAHPGVKFIVEDKPGLASKATKLIAANDLSEHITFLPHNFFEPQPLQVRGAAIYFLRNVLHDWSDSFARQILKNLVDAMDASSRVLICESVLPEPGQVPRSVEMVARTLDMTMWMYHGGRDRSMEEWKELVESVDRRLKITKVVGPPKGDEGVDLGGQSLKWVVASRNRGLWTSASSVM